MSHMQAILTEMFTKEEIFHCSWSSKPHRHLSFPEELSALITFDLINRQVYVHLLKVYTYLFVFTINPGMADIGWVNNLNYMIVSAYDKRDINSTHLLIAGVVGAAQQSSWDPPGCRTEWKYKVIFLQQEQVCASHLSPCDALDHKHYSKCRMLNNFLGPNIWWVPYC